MIRNIIRRLACALVDPIVAFINHRITEHAVRTYHREAWRKFRLLAVQEPDPAIAAWFEAQARNHYRFCQGRTAL